MKYNTLVSQGKGGRWRWSTRGEGWDAFADPHGHGTEGEAWAEWRRLEAAVRAPVEARLQRVRCRLWWSWAIAGVLLALLVIKG